MSTIVTFISGSNVIDGGNGLIGWKITLATENGPVRRANTKTLLLTDYPDAKTAIEAFSDEERAIVDKAVAINEAAAQKIETDLDIASLNLDSTKVVIATPPVEDPPPDGDGGGGPGGGGSIDLPP